MRATPPAPPERLPENEQNVPGLAEINVGEEVKNHLRTRTNIAWAFLAITAVLTVIVAYCEVQLLRENRPLVDPQLFEKVPAPEWAVIFTQVWLAIVGRVAVPLSCLFLIPKFAQVSLAAFRTPGGKNLDGASGHEAVAALVDKVASKISSKL